MTHPARTLFVIAITVALLSPFARAGEVSDPLRLDVAPPPPPPAKHFSRGTKTLEFEASYTMPIRYSVEELATGSVGVGYFLFDNHSLTLLAQGFHVSQAGDHSTEAGAVFLLGR